MHLIPVEEVEVWQTWLMLLNNMRNLNSLCINSINSIVSYYLVLNLDPRKTTPANTFSLTEKFV